VKNSTEVEVSITSRGTYHVGALTRGWSREEREALDRHDPEAVDELREEAANALRNSPDDAEMFFEIIE